MILYGIYRLFNLILYLLGLKDVQVCKSVNKLEEQKVLQKNGKITNDLFDNNHEVGQLQNICPGKENISSVKELEQLVVKQSLAEIDSSKVKELEAEVEKLTKKNNELDEIVKRLGEKDRNAENQAEQVLKDYEKVSDESSGTVAEIIANFFKSLNVNKLKEDITRYEISIDILINQLYAIEAAYNEREAEVKEEINALEQVQRS
uniref:Uncharacterized protein n=1 Tax=Panagrolaimus superbus TaxID=310955 RepID=A0A914YJ98_9BILA